MRAGRRESTAGKIARVQANIASAERLLRRPNLDQAERAGLEDAMRLGTETVVDLGWDLFCAPGAP